ncbi:hypothetical protein DdX_15137 [Ditylenchus destructor]|uniref:Uncharacterized protein n=1 Tax=Ditylenchus destructor TaxID=166010 RepID=A0AAD4R151_9BILA|nr:hypothetical protein DdX_15137 [Ditylenchus destructor]
MQRTTIRLELYFVNVMKHRIIFTAHPAQNVWTVTDEYRNTYATVEKVIEVGRNEVGSEEQSRKTPLVSICIETIEIEC